MKTIKYTIYTLLLLTIMAGCKKSELEQRAPDKLDTDNFWTTQDRALSGLAAAYSRIEGFAGYDNYVEARSVREFYREDMIVPGADAANYPWWNEHYNFNFTSGNVAIYLLWSDNYRGINFANQVLENVPLIPAAAIDESVRKMVLAEAKFLRAYYYFKLITNFEKVILRDKVAKSEADLPKPYSTRAEVYAFILKDLNEAEADLPLKSARPDTELGRVTKGAAQAYLGKVYLYLASEEKTNVNANYVTSASWFNKVVQSNEYTIDQNFLDMFNGKTRNGKESVFELQQSAASTNGSYYRSSLNVWVAASKLGGYGEIYGTPRLLAEMLSEGKVSNGGYDPRAYQTLFFNDPYFNDPANPGVYGKTFEDVFGVGDQTIAFRKWLPAAANRLQRSNAINMPLMRYSDVLLMYAEALNASGSTGDAAIIVNDLRAKYAMPAKNLPAKADVFNQIMHERVMEFTLESSRFYDLRRWGLLAQNMQAAGRKFTADKAFYPSPLKEVINNQ